MFKFLALVFAMVFFFNISFSLLVASSNISLSAEYLGILELISFLTKFIAGSLELGKE